MKSLKNLSVYIPYTYFIAVIAIFFTLINRNYGIVAYPILLLLIPFVKQIIAPKKYLNFLLGISFISITTLLITIYIISNLNLSPSHIVGYFMFLYGGIIIPINFIMALWMIRNSLKKHI